MTLNARNNSFIAGLFIAAATTLLYLLGSLHLIFRYPDLIPMTKVLASPQSTPLSMIIPIFLLILYLLIAEISIYLSFRKTSSAEIFFFFIFLLTTGIECFNLLLIYIDVFDLPFQFSMTVSRAIYFGRFLGSLSIFATGLFACGIPYQRLEMMLGASALAALALSTTIPLDSGIQGPNLLFGIGSGTIFFYGFMIVEVLGVLCFFYAIHHHNSNNYFFLALGMALVVAGKGLLFYSNNSYLMAGSYVMLIVGTILFGTKTHEVYLWF